MNIVEVSKPSSQHLLGPRIAVVTGWMDHFIVLSSVGERTLLNVL